MLTSKPVVSGKRVILALYRRTPVIGIFSCHLAAVAALYRMHCPGADPLVMTKDDLVEEQRMPDRIARALRKE